jgi:hypothetical protein
VKKMLLKIECAGTTKITQFNSFYQEGDEGEENFYMELYRVAATSDDDTICIDSEGINDHLEIYDMNFEEEQPEFVGIYTDSMVLLYTAYMATVEEIPQITN